MVRTARRLTLTLAAVAQLLLVTGPVTADPPCFAPPVVYAPAPQVSYYAPAPQVSYYAPAPQVSYYAPAPQVSYYAPAVSYYAPAPAVSYYTPSVAYYPPAVSYYAPAVSYYAAPGAATTTTYYGLFGRPRRTVTSYYP